MLDFTSALYLGLRHPSPGLRPWQSLTSGRPAALDEPPGMAGVAQGLARLQGCEAGVVMPSTLHLFIDLFGMLGAEGRPIYWDAGSYPIARWGVAKAACAGRPVRRFRHHDPDDLDAQLSRGSVSGRIRGPVVLTDGFCPACGRVAPLAAYQDLVGRYGGLLVIDDTQALGVLGDSPGARMSYGQGGGGTPRFAGLDGSRLLVGASLAKGLGVPVAVLSGDAERIRRFRASSLSRVHCSPPSVAVVSAAASALRINAQSGDALRRRLAGRVHRFRTGLAERGLGADGGGFPVQTLGLPTGAGPRSLHRLLLRQGMRCLLLRGQEGSGGRLGFLITARHSPDDIDRGVALLAALVRGRSRPRTRSLLNLRPTAVSARSCWR